MNKTLINVYFSVLFALVVGAIGMAVVAGSVEVPTAARICGTIVLLCLVGNLVNITRDLWK